MDKENKNDSSVRVQTALSLSALILVPSVFFIIIAWTMPTRNEEYNNSQAWTMPTRNEEYNNSQRSISSIYSSFVNQPEREVTE